MEVVVLALAGSATALATGLGAIPVSRLGERADELRPALWGLTVGLMTVASIIGLTGFGVSFATGIGYFDPAIKKLAAAIERGGAADPEVRRRTASLKMIGRIELAVLYVVVASMVAKPTGDDGGLLVVLALTLAAAVAGALMWRRRISVSA